MLEIVKSASHSDTVSVALKTGDHMGSSSEPPQRSTTPKELHATNADLARIIGVILGYEQFWISKTPAVNDMPWRSIWYETAVDDAADFYFQNAELEPQSIGSFAQTRLEFALRASFEADPLEDGMFHPAEEIIAEAFQSGEDQRVLEWFRAYSLNAAQPSFATSVLRCLGRQIEPGTSSWRTRLVRDGLAMHDLEIRDAAVQAAELWGNSNLIDVLESHSEPVTWLQDYISDVIDELRA